MAEWDWGLVRAQCLREAEGVLGSIRGRRGCGAGGGRSRLAPPGQLSDAGAAAALGRHDRAQRGAADRRRPIIATRLRRASPAEESHEDEVLGQADMDARHRRRCRASIATSSAAVTGTIWTIGNSVDCFMFPKGRLGFAFIAHSRGCGRHWWRHETDHEHRRSAVREGDEPSVARAHPGAAGRAHREPGRARRLARRDARGRSPTTCARSSAWA